MTFIVTGGLDATQVKDLIAHTIFDLSYLIAIAARCVFHAVSRTGPWDGGWRMMMNDPRATAPVADAHKKQKRY
jgi:hypothetical protein